MSPRSQGLCFLCLIPPTITPMPSLEQLSNRVCGGRGELPRGHCQHLCPPPSPCSPVVSKCQGTPCGPAHPCLIWHAGEHFRETQGRAALGEESCNLFIINIPSRGSHQPARTGREASQAKKIPGAVLRDLARDQETSFSLSSCDWAYLCASVSPSVKNESC